MSGSCLKRKASHPSQSHGEEHTQPWTLDFIDYIFLCSVSPSLSFSSATELTLVVFQCTSLHSLLNPSSTYTEFFSLHATVSSLLLPPWPAEHPYFIRQLSPPYYCGFRKTCPGELQSILFSLPAAVQNSSRHCHRRCFPAHHKHRCFGGMESAHEDIARAGSWPVRKVSSGGLNFKKTCKFLPGKFV